MIVDLLIIGGGIAGSYAALKAHALGLNVVLASKVVLEGGSTFWAQGGIAAPLGFSDAEAHLQDTLTAGRGLCEHSAVDVFVQEAERRLQDLYSYGVPFAQDGTLEGGHSKPRIRHAYGDATGRAISEHLAERVRSSGITLFEGAFAECLLLSESGRVVGAQFQYAQEPLRINAAAVLLATGGMGQVYPITTSPAEGTGDGMALAYRAGAELRDLEFVQFHPTVFVAGKRGLLVTEAARGEGGMLYNGLGERFMLRYDPLAELAPRDVVARAIATERERTGQVTLDLTHLGADFVRGRFPSIYARLYQEGLDIATSRIPVAPAVHYTVGGISTDTWGRTTVAGLYAAGEVASSGLHGANRLASNSLSEGLVFGARAVEAAANELRVEVPRIKTAREVISGAELKALRQQVEYAAGIVRSQDRIDAALLALPSLEIQKNATRSALEAGNMRVLAELLFKGASMRTESRGCHWRSDYPQQEVPYHVVHSHGQSRKVPLLNPSELG